MNRSAHILLVVFFLAAGIGVGVVLAQRFDRAVAAAAAPPRTGDAGIYPATFSRAADRAMRSVVHITTTSSRQTLPIFAPRTEKNFGSGVIVTKEGHILTNHHVARGAETLNVRFVDGRDFEARIVGMDVETDLALLKIDPGDRVLEPVVFAKLDTVRVGDWCLAVGSPFGLNHTVTAGIVSGKHRRTDFGLPYEDYLQTDAAMNPGNSGGALVNLQGEVIGINAVNISEGRSRGSDGVGLAISSDLAGWVVDQFLRHGRIRRGFLGIWLQDIEAGKDGPRGVLVRHVFEGYAGEEGGFQAGDLVVSLQGVPVASRQQLMLRVAEIAPGTEIKVRVLREGAVRELKVTLGERPEVR